jgi:hypothetical protein
MLDANGVESFVGGHYLQGGIGDMAVQDFAMVHVADEDADEARRLIAAYEGTAKSEDSVDSSPVSNKTDVVGSSLLTKTIIVIVTLSSVILSFYLLGN